METLRKLFWVGIFSLSVWQTNGQSLTAWQNAFYKSYDYEKEGNYANSIKELKKVYKTDDYFVNIRLGWLYYLGKEYAESLRYYQWAIHLKPYSIEARFGCVKPLSAMEKWEEVKIQYLAIIKIDPQNTLASYWLGVIYYNRKDYAKAANLFMKIVNLYPLDYDSVIMLAWTKLQMKKMSEAKLLFNHALTLRPNDTDALSGLKKIK
jgi:tetratricopeptide (TPR) repeat protein